MVWKFNRAKDGPPESPDEFSYTYSNARTLIGAVRDIVSYLLPNPEKYRYEVTTKKRIGRGRLIGYLWKDGSSTVYRIVAKPHKTSSKTKSRKTKSRKSKKRSQRHRKSRPRKSQRQKTSKKKSWWRFW